MRVAVILTGALRNFEVSMQNWQWPDGCDVDYFMVTWDKYTTNHYLNCQPVETLPLLDRATKLLPFMQIRMFNESLVPHSIMNYPKMLFMWKQAAILAQELSGYDSYIIMRPDLIMVPYQKLTVEFQRSIDPRPNKIITLVDEVNFTGANDVIVCFSQSAAKGIERLYDLALDRVPDLTQFHDIHALLADCYKQLSSEGIEIKSGFLDDWFSLTCRRQQNLGRLNPTFLKSEISHSRWFWQHQILGDEFEINIDVNDLYYG